MRILYINSLDHSGSTVLDMALGCHSNMIGLGEVAQILNADKKDLLDHPDYNEVFCSCGQPVNECEFWKKARQTLAGDQGSQTTQRYQMLIDHFAQTYGNDMILVDSSKNPNDYLLEINEKHDLRVIFLVRDVRSWIYSRHSRLGTNTLKLAYQWFKRNLKILWFLKKNNLHYRTFGYEEIALYPEEMLRQICEYVGVGYDPAMLIPDNTKSHVFNGNVAKGDKQKRKGFLYDGRWLTSLSLVWLGPLIFPLLVWNRKLVYSNFMRGRTRAFGKSQQDFLIFGDARKEQLVKEKWGIK